MNLENILITGSSGLVGAPLVTKLLNKSNLIVGIDPVINSECNENYKHILIPLNSVEDVTNLLEKYDITKIGDVKDEDVEETENTDETYSPIIKECLGELVEDVKASNNLIDSPVRLVAGEGGLDFNLERILKAQNPDFEGSKKILEINTNHDLIKKLPALPSETQKSLCRVLFEQARILDGEMPSDSMQFSKDLITISLKLA